VDVKNTPTYYAMATIKAVKSFIVQAPWANFKQTISMKIIAEILTKPLGLNYNSILLMYWALLHHTMVIYFNSIEIIVVILFYNTG
jgi:hypothetical protein